VCTGFLWLIDREMGGTNIVKKLHLPQLGDKTFRHFRITQMDQDIIHA
jgi:hypothetical protein